MPRRRRRKKNTRSFQEKFLGQEEVNRKLYVFYLSCLEREDCLYNDHEKLDTNSSIIAENRVDEDADEDEDGKRGNSRENAEINELSINPFASISSGSEFTLIALLEPLLSFSGLSDVHKNKVRFLLNRLTLQPMPTARFPLLAAGEQKESEEESEEDLLPLNDLDGDNDNGNHIVVDVFFTERLAVDDEDEDEDNYQQEEEEEDASSASDDDDRGGRVNQRQQHVEDSFTTPTISSIPALLPPLSRQPSLGSSLPARSREPQPQHVMISYCWNRNAKPELIKLLHQRLKSAGYDVWRDEEGSSLVPSMNGSIDDRIAEALERSAIVIICVSQAYKLSANCRMEASYANILAKKGLLKLCFVMMNEDYTTISHPYYCDGWLGIMIGDHLWYPLYSERDLFMTTREIISQLPGTTHFELRKELFPSLPLPHSHPYQPQHQQYQQQQHPQEYFQHPQLTSSQNDGQEETIISTLSSTPRKLMIPHPNPSVV